MNEPSSDTQISSLIRLLNDPDEFTWKQVKSRLLEIGQDAIPFLQLALQEEDVLTRKRALQALEMLHPQKIREKFQNLARDKSESVSFLEQGVLLIAEFAYPQIEPKEISDPLDALAEEFKDRLLPSDSARRLIEKLAHFLFIEKGYSGNEENYFDPNNSYFNMVLSGKKGIPITLSVLCVLVARRLDLPVFGVGMPSHFIAKYETPRETLYFDPYHQGKFLTTRECEQMIRNMGFDYEERFLQISTHREILIRMLNNLILIYNRKKETRRSEALAEYAQILASAAGEGGPAKR